MQALRTLAKGREGEKALETHASGFFKWCQEEQERVTAGFGCNLPLSGASAAHDAAKGWLCLELRSDSMLRRLGETTPLGLE